MTFNFSRTLCLLSIHALLLCHTRPILASDNAGPEEAQPPDDNAPSIEQSLSSSNNWSAQISIAFISRNNVGDVLSGGFEPAKGDSAGQIYSLMLTRTVHRFEHPADGHLPSANFEPYATLTLVDENNNSIFPDYNAGIGFRLVDFLWDKWLKTTLYMGLGLSYSSQVYAVDHERHPGEDRSHLKLDWPIQFSFALPRWPDHQLVIFNDHQSGGHIFDEGGINSVGIGYRYEF